MELRGTSGLLLRLGALRGVGAFALLVGVAAVVRSASLVYGTMDIDEAHWTLIGRILLQGGAPYLDFADHKPPLLFYTYAALVAVTDGNLVAIHALMLLWIACCALLVGATIRRLTSSPEAGGLAALAYVLLSSCNVITANSELLQDLPLCGGVYLFACALRGRRTLAFLAGLLFGVATLVRMQAGVIIVAVGGALLVAGLRGRRTWLVDGLLCAVGFVVPLVAVGGLFRALGHFDALWEWTIRRNIGYPPPARWPVEMAGAVALFGLPLVWALALAMRPLRRAMVLLRRRTEPAPGDELALLGGLLLVVSALAVAQGRRFYAHYFIQLALPLALLVGPRLVQLARDPARGARRWLTAALVSALLAPLGFGAFAWARGLTGGFPEQDFRVRAVVDYLRSPAAPPGRILVWGDSTQIYVAARRLPGSRFYNAAPLVGNFDTQQVPDGFDFLPHLSHADLRLYLDDAERLKPAIIIDTSTGPIHSWHRFPLRGVPAVRDYVARRYRLATTVAGVAIYHRR